jgi:hypothetical protein
MTANDKQTEKTPPAACLHKQTAGAVPKSFLTVGPMLHYSHKNVQRCWVLTVVFFIGCCFCWSKIVNGSFWSFNIEAIISPEFWRLDQTILTGVSIFEYPWQIVVLGLLMGVLAVVPVLMSQLMSFSYSLPFILGVALLANLPGFAICLLVSCFGAACRPLRFRSRFVAIALCMAPQFLYWGYFGGARGVEPIKWGFSFAPWICAWFDALCIGGIVLGIGHFMRYRPGPVWIVTGAAVLTAVVIFEIKIGFDELDYQLYVAKNNPENISEFHDHSITEALDKTITDPAIKKYYLAGFYSAEPITLRAELKRELQFALSRDQWPIWFIGPPELKYQDKRQKLLEQYDLFISKRPQSHRMPIALYYKALLSEYGPELSLLGEKETLHFYNDYPHRDSLLVWSRLYEDFRESSESLESRWRIARDWAGAGKFEQAEKIAAEAQDMIAKRLKSLEGQQSQSDSLFVLFRPPADSAMTAFKLGELQRRLNQLRLLIGPENRIGEKGADERLARFVMLNPYSLDYGYRLDELLRQTGAKDGLRDNILLAQAKLTADEHLQAQNLSQLHQGFQETDGGMQALYELGILKNSLWRQQQGTNPELKKKYLAETRATLASFISLYPNSFYAEQVKKNLEGLSTVE